MEHSFFQMGIPVYSSGTEAAAFVGLKEMISNLEWAPPTIAFLGIELNLLATDQDFSLVEDGEGESCAYLTTPSSFRACLTQITHAGRDAFQKAEINMEKVKMNSERIRGRCNKFII